MAYLEHDSIADLVPCSVEFIECICMSLLKLKTIPPYVVIITLEQ